MTYPLDKEMDDKWIEDFLFPEKSLVASGGNHSTLITSIKSWPNRTLLFRFYTMNMRQKVERTIISLTRIAVLSVIYGEYAQKHKTTLRIRRKPGEILEVDWAGTKAFIIDRDTGEKVKAYIFVTTLPCSQLSYAKGLFDGRIEIDNNPALYQLLGYSEHCKKTA
ncbi:transposase [Mesobacillus persicus]|uniref:transposase n=1 Tax=Mesobacillus persicus TaxID=930146 RepID=UPI001FCE0541|nr:transposase [Mesobacillus persicus]